MSVTSEAPAAFRNAAGDPGALRLIREGVSDILSRRRLVRYLVQADMRKRGADTVLGNFWWVLDPLLQMVVYWVFVSIIVRRDLPDYPLFIFAAILPWKWFTASVTDGTTSVTSQDRLIKQIQFPKLVLPVAATTAGVVGFAFGLIPLGLLMLFYQDRISGYLLLIPIIAAVQYVFTLAVAFLLSAGNVFFRDLGNVSRHVLRLWWYLSPGLYSLAVLDELAFVQDNPWLKTLAALNPFAILFESYRAVIYGGTFPDWTALALLLVGSLIFLGVTTVLFKRLEPNFAKVL
ncbi:MAG TPA: ABC transporter permease [Candidatus Saccharimonadales bacterium]|nr:ABC transporter permease [Candidatus Saccharimonadales bacterium]